MQRLGLVLRQRRRRLVQDQDPRPDRQRPGDLDQLPTRDAQAADQRAAPARSRACPARRPGPRPSASSRRRSSSTPSRVGSRPSRMFSATERFGRQRQLLVDQPDAQPIGLGRVADLDRPAVHLDRAGVGPHDAAQHLDQRRLPRAVLAEQGVDLAGPQVEIDPGQRHHAAEPLGHAAERQQRSRSPGGYGHESIHR